MTNIKACSNLCRECGAEPKRSKRRTELRCCNWKDYQPTILGGPLSLINRNINAWGKATVAVLGQPCASHINLEGSQWWSRVLNAGRVNHPAPSPASCP